MEKGLQNMYDKIKDGWHELPFVTKVLHPSCEDAYRGLFAYAAYFCFLSFFRVNLTMSSFRFLMPSEY